MVEIRERLQQLDAAFRQSQRGHHRHQISAISALNLHQEKTLLPNQVQVVLRYKKGEYLILEVQPVVSPGHLIHRPL